MRIEFPISVGNQRSLNVEMCCEHPTLCIYILLAPGCGLLPNLLFLLREWGWDGFCSRGLPQPCLGSVPDHTDRSIPPKSQREFVHSDPRNTSPALQTPTEHRFPLGTEHFFGYQHRQLRCCLQPSHTERFPLSIFVTLTKNIITCIMIKQSVI